MADLSFSVHVSQASLPPAKASFLGGTATCVSVLVDQDRVAKSPAVEPAHDHSVRWEWRCEVTAPHSAKNLIFQVSRPGFLGCSTVSVCACSLQIDRLSSINRQPVDLFDARHERVGHLVISVQREDGAAASSRGSAPPGGLTNYGGLTNRAAGADTSAGSSLLRNYSADISEGGGPYDQLPAQPGIGGLRNYSEAPPPTTASHSTAFSGSVAMSSAQGGLVNRAGTSDLGGGQSIQPISSLGGGGGGGGLQNLAAEDSETGVRANALPRAQEHLARLGSFKAADEEQRKALLQALEELRHVDKAELRHGEGKQAFDACSRHVQTLFDCALAVSNETDANGALWLAGRLPTFEEQEDAHVLQDKLKRQWDMHKMNNALDSASKLISANAAATARAPEELMDMLDLAEFHARQSRSDATPRVNQILGQLKPHVSAHLQQLLSSGSLDEVEDTLNIIGAGRLEQLGLEGVKSSLEGMRGIGLMSSALQPMPGQIGFPVLKQRQLRHATLTLRAALANDASGRTAAALRKLLLQDAIAPSIKHSAEAAIALFEAAFELHLTQDEVWSAAKGPYNGLNADQKVELQSKIAQLCSKLGISAPGWQLTPELARCQQAIRDALAGSDMAALQAALLQVKQTKGGQDVCQGEFQDALTRFKLPASWDVESMLAGGGTKKLLHKKEIPDRRVIQAFDNLLKRTTNPVWTRDRVGRVTQTFEAVKVVQVMNADTWSHYVQRRDDIAAECHRSKARHDDSHWRDNLNGVIMTQDPFKQISTLVDAPPLLREANEGWFIHGTSHVGAEAISSDDFDMARARPAGLFGAGIYLAESVSKADEYVEGKVINGVELFPLLLCRACLGYVYYCDERLPDKRKLEDRCLRDDWHSVLGDRKKTSGTFREFIVYDNMQVFPGFIVYYRRVN